MAKAAATHASKTIQVLTTGSKKHPAVQSVLAQLQAAGATSEVLAVKTDPPTLARGAKVLVPAFRAERALAGLLQEGKGTPHAILEAWKAEAEALLKVCRKLRQRAVMVDAEALARGATDAQKALWAHFDLEVAAVADAPLPLQATQTLVAAMCAIDPEAAKLARALDDKLIGQRAEKPLTGAALLARLADETRAAQDTAALNAHIVSLEEERDALRKEVMQVRSSVMEEQAAADADEVDLLRKSLGHALVELRTAEESSAAQATKLQALEDEVADKHMFKLLNDSLEKQLADAEDKRRRRESVLGAALLQAEGVKRTQVEDLQNQVARAEDQVEALGAEIDRIYNSNSWRLTAPMRSLRRTQREG